MKRRKFITLLGGAAVWPLAARAQQVVVPVIGFLGTTTGDTDAEYLRAFRQALKETGFVEGDNVAIAYRWADNQLDRLPALAAELVDRKVAVIATVHGPPVVLAAKAATATIPILFTVSEDPVSLGIVASLSRPGGNLTGINFLSGELVAKRLELLRELVPGATRVAVLVNPANAAQTEFTLRDAQAAARAMGLQIQILNASANHEIDAAFATFEHARPDALFVSSGAYFTSRRVQLVQLAARYTVPAAYVGRQFVDVGGLMSTEPALPMCGASLDFTPAAFSRAPNPPTCPSRRRASSSSSSITRPPACSASRCRRHCSPPPTR